MSIVMMFISCDKEANESAQHLFLTSPTVVEVVAESSTVTVSYNLVSPIDGETIKTNIVSGKEMISEITKPAVGIIRIEVLENASAKRREAVIEISYSNETTSIIIEQAAGNGNTDEPEVNFKARCLDGYYYGEKYGEGSERFSFFLSDLGLNNGGQAYTNGTYYYIDAFAPVTGSNILPNGTYRFDSNNTGAEFTINSENSQLILTGETVEDTENMYLENATMIVSENQIVLNVVIDGKTHKVTYTGGLELDDATEENGGGGNNDPTGGQEKDAQSTLTGDRNVTFDGEYRVKWVYEGDYWQTGYSNYTIMMMNKYNGYVYGDTLQLDIITDNTSKDGDFYGTYKCSYTAGKGVMMAGFTNDYAQAVGTWLFDYLNGGASYNGYAMIIDGELTISDAGNGNSTIVLNGADCHGNKITCNWTGIIEED